MIKECNEMIHRIQEYRMKMEELSEEFRLNYLPVYKNSDLATEFENIELAFDSLEYNLQAYAKTLKSYTCDLCHRTMGKEGIWIDNYDTGLYVCHDCRPKYGHEPLEDWMNE